MRIAILTFSPSGNTMKISRNLHDELTARGFTCQIVDLTGDANCFPYGKWKTSLEQKVKPHDLLIVGGPVYAHHLHYNVKTMIKELPCPDPQWGRLAIPFVTYGSISSGIALKEAGKLLNRSGRTVVAGMKIAMSHKMTRAFMDHEFNADLPEEPMLDAVRILVSRIDALQGVRKPLNVTGALPFNGIGTWIKAKIIFQEKKWHKERYPQVVVDQDLCNGCGKCALSCPVLHLQKNSAGKMEANRGECIHCLNCVTSCPQKAIHLTGDLEKGREFMSHMIACHANKEHPATAVYPLRAS